jgi:hypothetical protein
MTQTMAEFKYFTRLPPEIRNEVYKLLFGCKSIGIVISSPVHRRKRRPPQLDFTRLLLVNKQINAEAKTIFYSCSTFRIGNLDWGSTVDPNLHALKAFTARVPKPCIMIIRTLEIRMRFVKQLPRTWTVGAMGATMNPAVYQVCEKDLAQLKSLVKSVLKHFTGVE